MALGFPDEPDVKTIRPGNFFFLKFFKILLILFFFLILLSLI